MFKWDGSVCVWHVHVACACVLVYVCVRVCACVSLNEPPGGAPSAAVRGGGGAWP